MYDKNQLRTLFASGVQPLIRCLRTLGVKPTHITLFGFILCISACYAYYLGNTMAPFVLMVAGRICDALDGAYARATDQVTRFGGFIDSMLDRYGEFCVVGTILYVYRDDSYLYYSSFLVFLGIALMSYTRSLYGKYEMECPGNPFEYFERGLLLAPFFLLDMLNVWVIVVGVGTNFFVLQRIYLFSRAGARLN